MRPEAAAEARQVAAWLRERGIDHETLTPPGPPPKRTQAAARDLRYRALSRWSRVHDMAPILTAHHADDRLETLLMRLEAGTGVDGVAGPRGYTRLDGLDVVRPLLGVTKAALMATCRTHDQPWVEDPSNDDGSFTRVRIRKERADLLDSTMTAQRLLRLASAVERLSTATDRFSEQWFRITFA